MRDLSTLVWYVALVAILAAAALVGGFLVSRFLRARMGRSSAADPPFTLSDLRQMRSSGQITEQEFEPMRAAVVGHFRAASTRSASAERRGEQGPPAPLEDESPGATDDDPPSRC